MVNFHNKYKKGSHMEAKILDEEEVKKRNKIQALYELLENAYFLMDEAKRAKRTLENFNRVKEREEKTAKSSFVKNAEIQFRPQLEDIKIAEKIKESCISNIDILLSNSKEYINDDLAKQIVSDVKKYEHIEVDKRQDIYKNIEDATSVSKEEVKENDRVYKTDNYFLEIARSYSRIAKGLQRTINELDKVIEELGATLENVIHAEVDKDVKEDVESSPVVQENETSVDKDRDTESSPKAEEKKEDVKEDKVIDTALTNFTVDEIEMGIDFSDASYGYNEFQDEDEKEDLSLGFNSLLGNNAEKQSSGEDEDESVVIKP